jgi:alcohol dehydrogenase class IV
MPTSFNIPSTVITGAGASLELGGLVQRFGARRVLLVTDAFLEASGLAVRFVDQLERLGIAVQVFAGVQPDPTVLNVQAGLDVLRQSEAEVIVALGGGSPIDAAKAISVLATNPEPLSQYAGSHKIARAGVPLIAIPTTAGTGSEVTKVAVITDTDRDVKMMLLDAHLAPTAALVDYELSMSMPPALTAHVGVDTLTHGIEAYVSRKASALTDPLALACIRLVATNLETAWRDPHHRVARENMALAACQGGMAFANSSVGLVHGMSRPLGAVFHLAHGLSNAALLPTVTRYSLSGAPGRYATIARVMGYASPDAVDELAGEALARELENLNTRLGVPRLREIGGIDQRRYEAMLGKMAEDALASGSPQNNPVVPTSSDIVELYRRAW